ncbi:type II secretion system minor pseudopilin GspK [Aliikangiella sp. G2MR2-5]|uniref:type II secretion system minor pseudopilin GspK n=1 Tax=Aliikangiella sp. G2MR2-5 TaxID=2788943 RepID=UPI0018AAEB45
MRFTKRTISNPARQKGTALVTVVLIAAVVIVMVVESVKTVRFQKQLSTNLINRDQAYSYLIGMEELAKIYLKKAFEAEKGDTVHLGQLWAQDDITFPIDGGAMTASIKDMQSCFNLNTIAEEASTKNQNNSKNSNSNNLNSGGQGAATPGQKILEELIEKVKEDSDSIGKDLAEALKDWVDEDSEPSGASDAEDSYYQGLELPYLAANSLIAHESELMTIKGYDQKLYQQLRPYVCVLPDSQVNQINVNTITGESAALVYAVLSIASSSTQNSNSYSLSDVSKAISDRPEDGYENVQDFIQAMGSSGKAASTDYLDVTSHYFQMTAKAEIGKTRVEMKTLFKKEDDNNFKVVSRYFGRE